MKKELKKPVKETSELRVKAYAGEACVEAILALCPCYSDASCITIFGINFGCRR